MLAQKKYPAQHKSRKAISKGTAFLVAGLIRNKRLTKHCTGGGSINGKSPPQCPLGGQLRICG